MATEVLMPKLGATMEKGTIVHWFKQEGETVREGEPLLEIMTDKTQMEVESPASGTVVKILYGLDEEVNVQLPIAYIGEAGETVAAGQAAVSAPAPEAAAAAATPTQELDGGSLRATPAARRIAREQGIELGDVAGTGPRNRIQAVDVTAYAAGVPQPPKSTPLAKKIADAQNIDLHGISGTGTGGKIRKDDVVLGMRRIAAEPAPVPEKLEVQQVKLGGIRKVIAERMSQSVKTAAHVTLVTEADMKQTVKMRKSLLPVVERQLGLRLSYTEIIVKAAAYALRLHPEVNASLQGDAIVSNPHANIGLAVAVPGGLLVPVVKQAEQKSIAELTSDCKTITQLAREGKLLPDQMSGSTFTISNLGMYPVDAFTPIINLPETAILGVGRMNEKPVGVNGKIKLRPMMTLSLSFDHRVIDGAPAAAFLQTVKDMLENPYRMMV